MEKKNSGVIRLLCTFAIMLFVFTNLITGHALDQDIETDNHNEKNKAVEYIFVKEQPKLDYVFGDKLDLSALVLTVVYDDGSRIDASYNDLSSMGVSYSINNGAVMSVSANDGGTVLISYCGCTTETNAITVRKADPVLIFSGLSQVLGSVVVPTVAVQPIDDGNVIVQLKIYNPPVFDEEGNEISAEETAWIELNENNIKECISDVGVYSIRAIYSGGSNTNAAGSIEATLTIVQASELKDWAYDINLTENGCEVLFENGTEAIILPSERNIQITIPETLCTENGVNKGIAAIYSDGRLIGHTICTYENGAMRMNLKYENDSPTELKLFLTDAGCIPMMQKMIVDLEEML